MPPEICLAKHVHHIAIAVVDIDDAIGFYHRTFGSPIPHVETVADQKVKACLIPIGTTHLELIQPLDQESTVAKFIQRRGEGLHHICFQVDHLQEKLDSLASSGFELVDSAPRTGLAGNIAFIHPRSTRGILIELIEKP
ncbi:MAG: methylmalonyl-CoA epimerase [Chloroflexi bacterium]|nr:methylmalonyl-CoA epimerase [Chloroflexota bacterium]